MPAPWRLVTSSTLALCCITVLGACVGDDTSPELGAALCSDGRDNDKDNRIDCMDPDCLPMAFCVGPRDGGADHFVMLDAPPPAPDTGPPRADAADATPAPDLTPVSSYGTRCVASAGTLDLCGDGVTSCVYSDFSPGFCTHACAGQGAACPPGPPGTNPYCGYQIYSGGSWKWFCIFLCHSSSCPADLDCIFDSGGSFCF